MLDNPGRSDCLMHYSTGYFVFARALRSNAAARPKTATQDKDPAGVRGRGGEACFVAEDSHRRYNAAGTGAEVLRGGGWQALTRRIGGPELDRYEHG